VHTFCKPCYLYNAHLGQFHFGLRIASRLKAFEWINFGTKDLRACNKNNPKFNQQNSFEKFKKIIPINEKPYQQTSNFSAFESMSNTDKKIEIDKLISGIKKEIQK
jgi:hypothetical protein